MMLEVRGQIAEVRIKNRYELRAASLAIKSRELSDIKPRYYYLQPANGFPAVIPVT